MPYVSSDAHIPLVKSIDVIPNIINGSGVHKVGLSDKPTKLSLYLGLDSGEQFWVKDFNPSDLGQALVHAAKLSIYYCAPLTPVAGLDLAPVDGGNPAMVRKNAKHVQDPEPVALVKWFKEHIDSKVWFRLPVSIRTRIEKVAADGI